MDSRKRSQIAFRMVSAVVVTIALSATVAFAQAAAQQKEMAEHKQQMAEQRAMMARMTADDQALAGLVAKMNAATGAEKVAAMAAVINELVAQRARMQEQMRMHVGMMERMMSNMSAVHGTGAAPQKAPPKPTDATEADHAGHHPEQ